MSLEDELKDMNASLTETKSTEEEVKKDGVQEEVKEEEKVEAKDEEVKEEVKEPEVKEPEVKEEIKEEPKVDEPVVEDPKDKAIADLKAEVELLKASKPEEKKEEPKPPSFEPQDFVGGLDLDDITRDPKQLNEVLNNVYKKARLDAGESLLKDIPAIVKNQVETQQMLFKMAEEFYSQNSDLAPYKKNVALVFEEAISKNPDKPYSELMEGVAKTTREKLGIKLEPKKEVKKDPPPRLPVKGSSGRGSSDKPSVKPLQDELEAMNKSLGR